MADLALRTAEREARDGDPASEARLLTARVRAGDLLPSYVSLAATLGHQAALMIAGGSALEMPTKTYDGKLVSLVLKEILPTRPLTVAAWLNAAISMSADYARAKQHIAEIEARRRDKGQLVVGVDPVPGSTPVVMAHGSTSPVIVEPPGNASLKCLLATMRELAHWVMDGPMRWCPGRSRCCPFFVSARPSAQALIDEHMARCEFARQAERVAGMALPSDDVGPPHVLRGGTHAMKMRDVVRRLGEIDGSRVSIARRRLELARKLLGPETGWNA